MTDETVLRVATCVAAAGFEKEVEQLVCLSRSLWGDLQIWGAHRLYQGAGGRTHLMYSARTGQTARVAFLLGAGAALAQADEGGRTALHWAAERGHVAAVTLLLDAGADISAVTGDGLDSLLFACHRGHCETVALLLRRGASAEVTCSSSSADPEHCDCTPLRFACSKGSLGVARLLVEQGGADVRREVGCGSALSAAMVSRSLELVTYLLDAGAPAAASTTSKLHPLSVAAAQGQDAIAAVLLQRGADIEEEDNVGRTPLMHASEDGHASTVRMLCAAGAALDTVSQGNDMSALMYACLEGHSCTAQELLSSKADVHVARHCGCTAISLAASGGNADCVAALLQAGALHTPPTECGSPLAMACAGPHLEAARLLLLAGAPAQPPSPTEPTLLMDACISGHVGIVRLLVQVGGVKASGALPSGAAPVHFAAREGEAECLRALIELGADVNATVREGLSTPLMGAASAGHEQCVRVLLQAGANKGAKDSNGCTAWRLAKDQGSLTAAVRKLLR